MRTYRGRYFKDVRFYILFANKFTIGSLYNFYNKLPILLKTSLVYTFCCASCSLEYAGMASRTLGTIEKHGCVSYRTGARLTQPPHSVMRDHRDAYCTQFDTSNFKNIRKCLLYL